MGVFMSLHAWGGQHQFYISDSGRLGLQPVSPRCSTCTKQTRCCPLLFTSRQFLMTPYMQLGNTTDKCVKSVSMLILSVPMSPIGGRNSTSTSTEFYCNDASRRSWCSFQRQVLFLRPYVPLWSIQSIKSAVGLIKLTTIHLQIPADPRVAVGGWRQEGVNGKQRKIASIPVNFGSKRTKVS